MSSCLPAITAAFVFKRWYLFSLNFGIQSICNKNVPFVNTDGFPYSVASITFWYGSVWTLVASTASWYDPKSFSLSLSSWLLLFQSVASGDPAIHFQAELMQFIERAILTWRPPNSSKITPPFIVVVEYLLLVHIWDVGLCRLQHSLQYLVKLLEVNDMNQFKISVDEPSYTVTIRAS